MLRWKGTEVYNGTSSTLARIEAQARLVTLAGQRPSFRSEPGHEVPVAVRAAGVEPVACHRSFEQWNRLETASGMEQLGKKNRLA